MSLVRTSGKGMEGAQVQDCSKGIGILESGTFLLVESRTWEIFFVDYRMLGYGIRNTAQRIRIPLTANPSSTDSDSESRILGLESRIQNCLGLTYMLRHFCYSFCTILRGRSNGLQLRPLLIDHLQFKATRG